MDKKVPVHVYMIPDGNRRWAEKNGKHAWAGHAEGSRNFRLISDIAARKHIQHFTFWAASENNLRKRGIEEIMGLLALLKSELAYAADSGKFNHNHTCFRLVGHWRRLLHSRGIKTDPELTKLVRELEYSTRNNSKHHLTVLFGYDGMQELAETITLRKTSASPIIVADDLRRALPTGFLPPVDLVIRTGEEDPGWAHLSSGLPLIHIADAEFYSTPTFWPDFDEEKFSAAIEFFSKRRRMRGA
jgi:undecaprenyl diphosphate synthase